jgi:hypothetical protein
MMQLHEGDRNKFRQDEQDKQDEEKKQIPSPNGEAPPRTLRLFFHPVHPVHPV